MGLLPRDLMPDYEHAFRIDGNPSICYGRAEFHKALERRNGS